MVLHTLLIATLQSDVCGWDILTWHTQNQSFHFSKSSKEILEVSECSIKRASDKTVSIYLGNLMPNNVKCHQTVLWVIGYIFRCVIRVWREQENGDSVQGHLSPDILDRWCKTAFFFPVVVPSLCGGLAMTSDWCMSVWFRFSPWLDAKMSEEFETCGHHVVCLCVRSHLCNAGICSIPLPWKP